ncbi:MAG: hypothetical protein ACLSB9_25130 [Hydrogeniiclostridium mannosilyticum]
MGIKRLRKNIFHYLPDTWQQRKYSDLINYYDDVNRNSYSVTYGDEVKFETINSFTSFAMRM